MSAPGVPTPAAAPWSAPPADSPAAVGLKNGGLSEMTTDIIYPASRQIDGEFTGGRALETVRMEGLASFDVAPWVFNVRELLEHKHIVEGS